MILREETPQAWLDRTEKEAAIDLETAETSWIAFCKKVLAIQASDLWKSKAKTWHEYVKQTWNRDSSRIRQFKGSMPYAEALQQAFEDLATPEGAIRKMKEAGIAADDPNMPKIFRLVTEYATEQNVPVQTSFFKHAQGVYQEAETTGGFVDIGEDEIVPIDFEDSTKLAMARSIDEARQRYRERLNNKRQMIEVTAKRIADNQYLITSDEELPESFQFKLWKDADMPRLFEKGDRVHIWKLPDNVTDDTKAYQGLYGIITAYGDSKDGIPSYYVTPQGKPAKKFYQDELQQG